MEVGLVYPMHGGIPGHIPSGNQRKSRFEAKWKSALLQSAAADQRGDQHSRDWDGPERICHGGRLQRRQPRGTMIISGLPGLRFLWKLLCRLPSSTLGRRVRTLTSPMLGGTGTTGRRCLQGSTAEQ
jgi:hypothetical protein